jgi:hypothetical protein
MNIIQYLHITDILLVNIVHLNLREKNMISTTAKGTVQQKLEWIKSKVVLINEFALSLFS